MSRGSQPSHLGSHLVPSFRTSRSFRVQRRMFGVCCLVFGVWRLEFGIWCLVFGVWFGVWKLVCGVWGLGFGVNRRQGFGVDRRHERRVWGSPASRGVGVDLRDGALSPDHDPPVPNIFPLLASAFGLKVWG